MGSRNPGMEYYRAQAEGEGEAQFLKAMHDAASQMRSEQGG